MLFKVTQLEGHLTWRDAGSLTSKAAHLISFCLPCSMSPNLQMHIPVNATLLISTQ